MSSPLRSVPKNMGRRLGWALAVVACLLLFCGLSLGLAGRSDGAESREADKEMSRYLSLVQARDRVAADAMLCGADDTSTADLPDMYRPDWHLRRVESFAIVRAWDWSSMMEGHGKGYEVLLVFADRSTATVELAVEVIADDPCIATQVLF
ncbi:hypothetical protein [Phytohabitans rumicis]|uniref:Uncharacterized protein n=1 Tax=Phytohabitans rumicis TaxID=1076125 RepID=A0A6V8LDZ1_9ACTN|nr:hypothetical protein [Phytohabitans rumicis]GFJ95462.1 hypothetical protein Prum_091040 [Phytohabitans rumicis]